MARSQVLRYSYLDITWDNGKIYRKFEEEIPSSGEFTVLMRPLTMLETSKDERNNYDSCKMRSLMPRLRLGFFSLAYGNWICLEAGFSTRQLKVYLSI